MSWEHGALPNRGLRHLASALALCVLGVVGAACSSGGASGGSSDSTVNDGSVIGTTTDSSATTTTPSSSAPTTTTIDPNYATLAALLPTNVPSGLPLQPDRLADTGATNLSKAIQDDVSADAGSTLRSAGFVIGYQRAWTNSAAVKQNTLFVYKFKTAAGAAQYASSRAAALESENSPNAVEGGSIGHFPVLIPGAVGLHSEGTQSSFGAVVFSKGVYSVVAVATDAGNVDQSGNAAALAAAQNLILP
ncbi:MAG: hypothetical protein QOE62_1054 [Actinomycetota bacterium]|nr:hypothetical protein [Actinomycetota bacterium]